MKSGTNWLGSLLSSHEQISCVGEFHWQEIMEKFNANLLELPLFQDEDYSERARRHVEDMIRKCLVDAAEPTATCSA